MDPVSATRQRIGRLVAAVLVTSALPLAAQERAAVVRRDLRLIDAVREQDRGRALTLIKQGIDVNVAQPDGATALHWAVHWEDVELVDRLLAAKAKPNLANDLGVTPIVMAATAGNGQLVQKLLGAGADANASLESGETVLMLAAQAGSEVGVTALLARGARVDAREGTRGQTALMWAIVNKHPAVTRILLEHGADIRLRSETRKLVYNMGGNRSAGRCRRHSVGRSAARRQCADHVCRPLRRHRIARMLVAKGASVNDTEADGNTALIVAAHSGHGRWRRSSSNRAPMSGRRRSATPRCMPPCCGHARDRGVKNDDPARACRSFARCSRTAPTPTRG
jgi:ankyrin repeat protein